MTMGVVKFMKKVSIVFGVCCTLLLPSSTCKAEAADVYTVIYSTVSQWNGDAMQANWITSAILYACEQYGVDPLLVTAIMETESHFNISAASYAGAIGLMQLMPSTAASIGVNPGDPLGNVCGGVAHLRTLLDSFSGWGDYAVTDAVAAYNAGAGSVQKYNGVPPYGETRNYVIKVSNAYNRLLANYN